MMIYELLKVEGINVNDSNNDGETALSKAGFFDFDNPANTEAIRALLREHSALELNETVNDNDNDNENENASE